MDDATSGSHPLHLACTDDPLVYQQARLLRSHGMVREANDPTFRDPFLDNETDLNPDFIFAYPAYNVRNTEIGGILGKSQLKRIDHIVKKRNEHFMRFLDLINVQHFKTDFKLEGMSNYAFNLVLREADHTFVNRLMMRMREYGIEFRRGSAGGGNQVRQPYLKEIVPHKHYLNFPNTDHIHYFGFYIGNYPELRTHEINDICAILNSV